MEFKSVFGVTVIVMSQLLVMVIVQEDLVQKLFAGHFSPARPIISLSMDAQEMFVTFRYQLLAEDHQCFHRLAISVGQRRFVKELVMSCIRLILEPAIASLRFNGL